VETSAPGWYPDPTGRHQYRYWTGRQWSAHVADSRAEIIGGDDALPSPEAFAEATGARALPEAAGGGPPRSRRPHDTKRRSVVVALLLGLVAAGSMLYVILDDRGEDDVLLTALRDYIEDRSGGAVEDEGVACMAERFVHAIGRDRLAETDVADGADPLQELSPDVLREGLPPAFECLDDAQFEAFIAATLEDDILEDLAPARPECLAHGWMEGFGREEMSRIYVTWASRATIDLPSVLNPDQLSVLGDVITECATAAAPGAQLCPTECGALPGSSR
jgi:hypothetical protein